MPMVLPSRMASRVTGAPLLEVGTVETMLLLLLLLLLLVAAAASCCWCCWSVGKDEAKPVAASAEVAMLYEEEAVMAPESKKGRVPGGEIFYRWGEGGYSVVSMVVRGTRGRQGGREAG